jgi:very-short-patch-repair endonuclease
MPLPYQYNLIPRAKELRKNATKQENHLWYDFLRTYPVRFQRQKSIGSFIADFYCYSAKLIIELDGAQHYSDEGMAYDKERSQILNEYGLYVLRFSNSEVDKSFDSVCKIIDTVVKERSLPLEGGAARRRRREYT